MEKRISEEKGFTLVELLIVVVVVGLASLGLASAYYAKQQRLPKELLGIEYRDIDFQFACAFGLNEGVGVVEVVSGSPANVGGLRRGDIIVAVLYPAFADLGYIRTGDDLIKFLKNLGPGGSLTIRVFRAAKVHAEELKITFPEKTKD